MQAHEDDALKLLAVAADHITSCGYTAKVIMFVSKSINFVFCMLIMEPVDQLIARKCVLHASSSEL